MERQWHLCEDGEASKHTPVMNVCLCSFVAKSGRFAICHVVVVHCGVGWRGRHWHRRFMIIIFGITGSEGSLHKSWSMHDCQLDFEPQLDTSITSNSGYACREYGAESSHLVHMCCNSFGKCLISPPSCYYSYEPHGTVWLWHDVLMNGIMVVTSITMVHNH